ncbi:argonaute-2-like isoform X1 [Paramuricea clavata]|uniref:Argonaute-2-like isoform X1 n=2 Tax=Paramuricea clavata TaxID=317549 RepID=A0A7D9IPU3_PARCT|nr:argonaute-2-like isoform X1 [Paramuricea clavata]
MFALEEALKGRLKMIPFDSIEALDVVLRYSLSSQYISIGRSFFSPPVRNVNSANLECGREVWFGFHQSVRPSQWKMLVNIDSSATAFHKAISVIEFLSEVIGENPQRLHLRSSLNEEDRTKFIKEIKGLKIEINHCGEAKRKYRVFGVTREPACILTFPRTHENGQSEEITVQRYFLEKYKRNLLYGHLPCLQVGQPQKQTFLPLEVCSIVSGQRCTKKLTDKQTTKMIKCTAKPAPDRQQEIIGLMHKANFSNDKHCQEFGITVQQQMVSLTGRVLPPPKLVFGGREKVTEVPRNGVWVMKGKQLFHGVEIKEWAIVSFAHPRKCSEDNLRNFTLKLTRTGNDSGMPVSPQPCFIRYARNDKEVGPLLTHIKTSFKDVQLIIVVLNGKSMVYAEVKRIGDTLLGVATQCLQLKNVVNPSGQTLANLCLKINVKLGGINTILAPEIRPPFFKQPVIFFGADVTHPTAGDEKKPSIAAVVGSMDAHPSRYSASVRVQTHRQEIIGELSSMVRELLIQFYQATNHKPCRIIFYRDGVSEGQFDQVISHELKAVREACLKLESGYKPGITFIVVQKRHHTRLFCVKKEDQCGRSDNIPPGTMVDSGITHPTEFDFYLCSHFGVQGTSRPSHYHVLWDDNNFTADEIQALTYQLCHTYVRCSRSVSIPAPAFYAHLVAFRARYHLQEKETASSTDTKKELTAEFQAHAVQVHPNSLKYMYFA